MITLDFWWHFSLQRNSINIPCKSAGRKMFYRPDKAFEQIWVPRRQRKADLEIKASHRLSCLPSDTALQKLKFLYGVNDNISTTTNLFILIKQRIFHRLFWLSRISYIYSFKFLSMNFERILYQAHFYFLLLLNLYS